MRRCLTIFLLLGAAAVAEEHGDSGEDEELEVPGTRECVSLVRIDRTRIVNDQTILFYMLGPDVYVNYLPRRCNGLKRTDAFSYATSLSQLCHLDVIRGLRNFGGQLSPTVACGLGKFVPINEEQIELLLAEPELEPEPVEPEVEPVAPEIEPPEGDATDGSPQD